MATTSHQRADKNLGKCVRTFKPITERCGGKVTLGILRVYSGWEIEFASGEEELEKSGALAVPKGRGVQRIGNTMGTRGESPTSWEERAQVEHQISIGIYVAFSTENAPKAERTGDH